MSVPAKPTYDVKLTDDAAKSVQGLDGSVKKPLKKVFEKKLAVDPEGYGTELRAPLTGYWKHEFLTHRVIYRVYNELLLVVVCAVGPRKSGDSEDVYKRLEPLINAGKLAEQISVVLKASEKNVKPTKDAKVPKKS